MKKLSQFIYLSVIGAFMVGCGSQVSGSIENEDNSSFSYSDNKPIVTNGKHKFIRTIDGKMQIFTFNMPVGGYINIEANPTNCNTKIFNTDGKSIGSIYPYSSINPMLVEGKYYIKIESKNGQCDGFELFSPKILDKYTNENEKSIKNGTQIIPIGMNIYSFSMPESGYTNIEASSTCHMKLFNSNGKLLNTMYPYSSINPELNQGKYYIKIESKGSQCDSFELFSPKIVDNYTDGSQGNITNGNQDI